MYPRAGGPVGHGQFIAHIPGRNIGLESCSPGQIEVDETADILRLFHPVFECAGESGSDLGLAREIAPAEVRHHLSAQLRGAQGLDPGHGGAGKSHQPDGTRSASDRR